ncbi:MAG: extracellular solute-binding protein, partial [Streptococcaceae bacterium]|nr:extracellular solute-binding protein [Streptococcaceae bacterium]
MKSWKKIAVVSTAFIAAAALTACSGSSSSSKTITIGLWKGSDAESAAFKKLVTQFEKDNNATVKTKIYSDYTTQLTTDLSGGTVPDVFYVDSSFYPYLQK